jgi:puromycin-sensitive aminopeptidase
VAVSSGGATEATTIVMDNRQASLRLPAPRPAAEGQWFKVNFRQAGFFRVNYAPEDWERLVPAIRSLELPATDRLGIQNDAYALSRAGLLPVTQFLSLARAYEDEDDASVWGDLASNLKDVEVLLANEPLYGAFQGFCRGIFQPAAKRCGWEARPGEGHLDALLRSTVLSQSGNYGNADVLGQARERFQRYLEDPDSVRPDIRGVVFSLAGQAGDRATYDQLWETEAKATLQEEKIRLLMALTRFSQPELLRETLERALSPDVRSQDTISVVAGVASNLRGRELTWEFVKAHWPEFDRRYGGGGFGLMRLVSICGNFTNEGKRADVESFFQEHPAPAAERTIRQSLERVRLNIKWLERNRTELAGWFAG